MQTASHSVRLARAIATIVIALMLAGLAGAVQSLHEAPAGAPSTGRVTPAGEPGQALRVNGVVVGATGSPVAGASLYIYQTDREGYYGVKPASDNRNPRLKLYLRSDASGAWSFETIRPGSYPGGGAPQHIHFEVSAKGFAPHVFEIVFEDDPLVTKQMYKNPAFSVRPVKGGVVTERIVLR